ncbi:MAG: MFS transporter [Bacilli bacterium]|nr:MFS transporter [Bacilli bacterium]
MKKDNLIFIHRLLKSIGDAIITVFIPLYILKNTDSIILSTSYLVLYTLFVLFFMFVFKHIIQKYGVFGLMLHFIPVISSEAILSFCPINILTILIVAALMGLAQATYSIPINLVFAFGDKKTNVSKFQIATNIGKLIFTFVSGFILSSEIKNSFLFLAIASSLFYIASTFPIAFAYKELKQQYNSYHQNIEDKKLKPKVDIWFRLFHISFGLFQPIMDNVLPLYLYLVGRSFKAVTIVIVLVELFKILMNLLAKLMVHHQKEKICVIIGSIIFMLSIIGLVFIPNPIILYILSCTCSISFPLTFVPMFKKYCEYLKQTNNIIDGMTMRDFDIFSFRAPMFALSYIGLLLYPSLLIGFLSVPIMLVSEIKILNKQDYN